MKHRDLTWFQILASISLEPTVLIYPMQSAPGVEMHVEPSKLKMEPCPIHLNYPPESVNHVTNRWTSL